MKDRHIVEAYLYKEAWRRSGEPPFLETESYKKPQPRGYTDVNHFVYCSYPVAVDGVVETWSCEKMISLDGDTLDIGFWMGVVEGMKAKIEEEA